MNGSLRPIQTDEAAHSYKAIRAERARRSLEIFVEEAWPIVEPATTYSPNWHVGAVCYYLEAITAGHIQNLVINIPPGFMKSLLAVVFWPAWEWIDNPHIRYITASHGRALAIRDTKRSRDIISSSWYQYFYGDSFYLEGDQNQKLRYQNNHKGYRVATSIGSGTGERGNRVIFDDPHELDDVYHPEAIKAAVEYNNVTLDSRLANRELDSKIVVQQRVAKRDVTGDILQKMEVGGKHYEVLCLPMRYSPAFQRVVTRRNVLDKEVDPRTEAGELLDPKRYSAQSVKQDLITYANRAPAILDQNPKEDANAIFERSWWANGKNRYTLTDYREILRRYLFYDMAMKDKEEDSYNSMVVLELINPGYFVDLRYVWRNKLSFPRLMRTIEPAAMRWDYDQKLTGIIIEDKAHGITTIQTIEEGMDDWLKGLVVPFDPGSAPKIQRWNQAAAWAPTGSLRLPHPAHSEGEVGDLYAFEEELYELPSSEYKDWADCYAMGIIYLEHLIAEGWRYRESFKPAEEQLVVHEGVA